MAGTSNMPSQGENAAPGQVAISGHLPEMPTPSQFTPPYIDAEWREEGNAQAPKPMLNATKLLTGFKQRWRSAVLVGLVLGIIAGVVTWFLVPSRYTAFAYLEVSNEDPQIIPDKNRSSQTDKTYQNTQAQIVKSHPILLKALQDPKVRNLSIVHDNSDPIGWIEEEITATYPEN